MSGHDSDASASSVQSDVSDVLAPPTTKALPSRSTRGRRMGALVGEEAEADESFWGQDAWNADDSDFDMQGEKEQKDKFDSDFNDTEDSDNEVFDADGVDQRRNVDDDGAGAKRRSAYREPAAYKRRRAGGGAGTSSAAGGAAPRTPRLTAAEALQVAERRRGSLRRSTASKRREREVREKKQAATAPRRAKRVAAVQRAVARYTQDELLDQAVTAETANLRALERMRRAEDATKRDKRLHSTVQGGSRTLYHSKRGCADTITFTGGAFPAVFTQEPPRRPERTVCAVTGAPARYRDPVTGQPYATLAAFKELRRRQHRGTT